MMFFFGVGMLDELQEHVESIDMANGESFSFFDLLVYFSVISVF